MCGIAGFVGRGDRGQLERMLQALAHRGPDDSGWFHLPSANLHLGHRRLSILDIEGGHQPMWNEDHQIGVVFNGEIYNHAQLRQRLIKKGHRFRSDHSDTEVLVHGYEEWGEELPLVLNGMFAFAIVDGRERRLFLARDRFGEKPLYYHSSPGLFAFASELRALALHPGVDRGFDDRAVQKLLAHGFIPSPNTLYRGANKLPAGHAMTVDLGSTDCRSFEYWRFKIEPRVVKESENELAEQLDHLLNDAVRRRLISDVPIGVFLSGGIDSSAIVAHALDVIPAHQLQTFSIGFEDPSFDESSYALFASRHFGAQHHHRLLTMGEARDLVPNLLDRLDEPQGDPSIVPTSLLSGFARTRVTVALGGDGGDELFAGYDPFRALRTASMYAAVVPSMLHRGVRWAANHLPVSTQNMSLDFKVRRFLRGLSYPEPFWNPVWLGALEPADIADLYGRPIDVEDLFSEALSIWNQAASRNLVDRTLEFYTRLYLPDDILTKVDRASMLHSLETRAPFLDNDLVDFVRQLPFHLKLRGSQTKYLLKQSLRQRLPALILDRKKKGFGIPLTAWLRDWPTMPDWPGGRSLSRHWSEHRQGRADHRQLLWTALALAPRAPAAARSA